MPVLAIDLGGTKTLAALVDGAGILERREIATDRTTGPAAWVAGMADLVRDWQGRHDGIGLTVTGLVSDGLWRPLNPETLPLSVEGYPLADAVKAALGGPAVIRNDAQAAAWGEHLHGAGQGRDMVFLTVSTGIGAGIVLNGQLAQGRFGLAGHAGQMIAMPDGDDAPFEDMASGRWIARQAGRADARAVFAEADDPACAEAIGASARRVARLCRNLQFLLSPDVIVIGGGIGLAPGYLSRVREALASLDPIRRPLLEPAALGADAGVIGIAALAADGAPAEH